jgi:hypothetical protein
MDDEDVKAVLSFIFVGVLCVCGIFACVNDKKDNEQYGRINYEFVIVDKYEKIGSEYHMVGGRATETEYHVIYKYRLTNRPNNKKNMIWYERDTEVRYISYRRIKIGDKYQGVSSHLNIY